MASVLSLDPFVAVLPGRNGRLRVSSPHVFEPIEATPYQLQLLLGFREPASLTEVLKRYPFEKEESAAFLEACQTAGLLRPEGAAGPIAPPDRVPAHPRWVGAPAFEPGAPAAFALLGVPFDGNTTGQPGARFGPAAVRAASEGTRYLLDPLTQQPQGFFDYGTGRKLLASVSLADAGDVYVSPGEDGPELYARVTDVVRDLVQAGTLPLVVGGDHSLTAPILSAFPNQPMQIVHLDAHADLGDVERGDGTGLHHGNVFTVALDALPHIERMVQVGLRGIIEANAATNHDRVRAIGMDAFRAGALDAALDELIADRPTYLSIDIDVVDPSFAPSTGTPVPGGLYPHELKAAVRTVARRFPLIGVDVMEVAQPVGPSDNTAGLALEALLHAADATVERMLGEMAVQDA